MFFTAPLEQQFLLQRAVGLIHRIWLRFYHSCIFQLMFNGHARFVLANLQSCFKSLNLVPVHEQALNE